jgi:drug/metabolite transporter (DMT)-like permease
MGLSLAVATAVGCVAYERLVKSLSYTTVGLIISLDAFIFTTAYTVWNGLPASDLETLRTLKLPLTIFIASGITSPLWYFITRKQSVMAGSIYEVKYIVILAVVYILFGSEKMTWNTALGVLMAMCSIYFISK